MSNQTGGTSQALRIEVGPPSPAAMEIQHQGLPRPFVRQVDQIGVGGVSLLDLAARKRPVEPIGEGGPSELPAEQDDRHCECEFQSSDYT